MSPARRRPDPWAPFPTSPPRPVDNGLKARTARGAIGSTWWSRRFLDVLEALAVGGRLDRGRAYARKGQVVSLDVTPGQVRAVVQGSRPRPYVATIGLPVFTELVWTKVEIALSEQALAGAKLLAGEVPLELESIFDAAGAPLFPRAAGDLTQHCSCPDIEVPCKHLAATFYLLAEAFDTDPFLVLHWRGRDRDMLLDRLRTLRSGPHASAAGAADIDPVTPVAGTAAALGGLSAPSADVDRFWDPAPPRGPRAALVETEPDLVLRQLPAPPEEVGGAALVVRLREDYTRLAQAGPEPTS